MKQKYFDGTLAIRFDINGYERTETIYPDLVESDPDLEGCWRYPILMESDAELKVVLMGEYDGLRLSTKANLKVIDYHTDSEYYADYDILNAATEEADDDDNWEWFSVLYNQAYYDKSPCLVVPMKKDILDDSIAANGGEKLKAYLREKIKNYLNMEIEDEEEFTELIDRLSIGEPAEYKGEHFWWEQTYVMMSL